MFPIHDETPTRITPFVTYALIGANIFIFLYQLTLSSSELQQFFQTYALVPRELSAALTGEAGDRLVPEALTLVSSQFLHGGIAHIFGNMLFLWIFGNNIEEQLGHIKYLIFYIACGVLAALSQWFFSMGSSIPSLGASGAIAGVMGAYILKFPQARIRTVLFLGPFITFPRIPAFFFLGFWFVMQALYGVVSLNAQSTVETGGIAYWAHAGGFVFGAILGPLLGLFSDSPPRS